MDKWILQHPVEPEQVLFFSRLIDLAVSSDSHEELCKKIVHEDITQGFILGCHLYSVDTSLDMQLQISYGKATLDVKKSESAWGTSPLSKCITDKKMHFQPGKDSALVALPLAKTTVPLGALLLVMSGNVKSAPLSEPVAHLISKLWAFFIEVRPRHSPQGPVIAHRRNFGPGNLSARQIRILELQSAGLTNGRIGAELSLSESTVRQETIKIYQFLGVSGKREAVDNATDLGLISKS